MSVIIHKTVIKNNTYFTVSIGENNLRCLTRWYPSHLDLLSQAPLRLSCQAPENPPNSMRVSSQSLVLSCAMFNPSFLQQSGCVRLFSVSIQSLPSKKKPHVILMIKDGLLCARLHQLKGAHLLK